MEEIKSKNQEFEEPFNIHPYALSSDFPMTEANEPIKIYEGGFQLKFKEEIISVEGTISFKWFPQLHISIVGKTKILPSPQFYSIVEKYEVLIDNIKFSESYISFGHILISDERMFDGSSFNGTIGDKSIPVDKVTFSIPNLKELLGNWVKVKNVRGIQAFRGRLVLSDDEYEIVIDKRPNFKDLNNSVQSKGGYILNYNGEIKKKDGHIKYADLENLVFRLSIFFSFINGRTTCPLFFKGIHGDSEIWCNYNAYSVSQYKQVQSWTQRHSIEGINEIWKKFCQLWKNDDDQLFLIYVTRWYVEANSQSSYTESSIISAQTALELIYNWLLIENRKLLIGKDAEGLLASNKLRLLLSIMNVKTEISSKFLMLKKEAKDSNWVDGPEAFVQIRNAIVHSQEEKREKLSKMDELSKYQALQLGVWYIELSLLYILGHKAKYYNRCAGVVFMDGRDEDVPWK